MYVCVQVSTVKVIIATVVSFTAKLKDAPIKLPVVDKITTGYVM